MNCTDCGTRIPDELLEQESFACPNCGSEYERAPQQRRNRYAEYEREAQEGRYEDDYDDGYADDYGEYDPYEPDEGYYQEDDGYTDDEGYVIENYPDQPQTPLEKLQALVYQPWFKPIAFSVALVLFAIILLIVVLARPNAAEANVNDYVAMLKNGGLPIGEVVTYNKSTDPNGLLGQEDQYIAKATFADTRLAQADGSEPNGGTIEVFANNDDMQARKAFITSMAEASPDPAPYIYESSDGLALVRLSTDFSADEAAKYDQVLHGIAVVPGEMGALPEPTEEPVAVTVPEVTPEPTAVYTDVKVPAGKYVVGERFPVGTYNIRVDSNATSCVVSLYETVDSLDPYAVYELSALGSSVVNNLELKQGVGITIEGDPLICDVYQ